MEIDSDSSAGSKADDEVMGGDSDEEEDAASKDPKGKGKARVRHLPRTKYRGWGPRRPLTNEDLK